MTKRSGSSKRQRTQVYSIRFTPAEHARAMELCNLTGLCLSALIRHSLFKTPPPRAARRPTVESKLVAQLLGQLGKIGGNLNQLAKQANAGNYQTDAIDEAMLTLIELRSACMEALGREKYNYIEPGGED